MGILGYRISILIEMETDFQDIVPQKAFKCVTLKIIFDEILETNYSDVQFERNRREADDSFSNLYNARWIHQSGQQTESKSLLINSSSSKYLPFPVSYYCSIYFILNDIHFRQFVALAVTLAVCNCYCS